MGDQLLTPKDGQVVRSIKHYQSCQKFLLVGQGDFSFSACLARFFRSASNITATSLDSEDELVTKHWSSVAHIEELERLGCEILHEIDVHNMHVVPCLIGREFDRIIFNFPHAGHFHFYRERDMWLIEQHKELLLGFFRSSRRMLSETGEVHVVHRDDEPYDQWDLEKLVNKAGLVLIDKVEFLKTHYPGYHNKRGGGIKSNQTFPIRDCYTFKFALPSCSSSENGNSKSSLTDILSSLVV